MRSSWGSSRNSPSAHLRSRARRRPATGGWARDSRRRNSASKSRDATSRWKTRPQLATHASRRVAACTCTCGSACPSRRSTARRQSRAAAGPEPARSQISRMRPHSSLVLFSLVALSVFAHISFLIRLLKVFCISN